MRKNRGISVEKNGKAWIVGNFFPAHHSHFVFFSRHYPLNPLKTLHDYVISADEQSMGRWQARSQLFEKLWTHL
ncbi:hypothetical protein WDW37_04465, partial [Bdellovibrionota bacterium FG-1]